MTLRQKAQTKIQSWDNHGTACAGIAAALTHNKAGIAGLSLNSRIMPIELQPRRSPEPSDEIHGLLHGIPSQMDRNTTDQGADVLSNSWVVAIRTW